MIETSPMAAMGALLALSMAVAGTALDGSSSRLIMSPLHLRSAAAGPGVALNVSDGSIKEPAQYSGYFQVATLLWQLVCLVATPSMASCYLILPSANNKIVICMLRDIMGLCADRQDLRSRDVFLLL